MAFGAKYDFSGAVIAVTGGTRGIGREICEHFAAFGAKVSTCGRREPETAYESELIEFTALDVRDAEQSQAWLDSIESKYSRLDVLINNAGGSPAVASADASASFTRKIIELNLVAPLVLAQQAYPLLRHSRGNIINISSISVLRPTPRTMAYGAAKAGLTNATQSLAQEWGPDVRVNSIIAGMVVTELTAGHYGGGDGQQAIADTVGMKRFATPTDIAKACLYLASADAGYVSGAALEVHGGGEMALSVMELTSHA
jgi:NAD(P)-dependent dehydrogenase (short-subunit alcohol dehydrogenase family)